MTNLRRHTVSALMASQLSVAELEGENMRIYAFYAGTYTFEDSVEVGHWADMGFNPVSARNYAEFDVFTDDEWLDDEWLVEDIHFRLDDVLGKGWIIEPGDDYSFNEAVSVETNTVFPFTVRRRIKLISKSYDGLSGEWIESFYPIPRNDIEELMEPAVTPKVWIDCD